MNLRYFSYWMELVSGMFSSDAIYPLDPGLNLSPAFLPLLLLLLLLLLLFWDYIWNYFLCVQQHFVINAPAILFWLLILDLVFSTLGDKRRNG